MAAMEVDGAHVHFQAEQIPHHENDIVYEYPDPQAIKVHVGFLQVNHHYEVSLVIRDRLGEDLACDPLQNLHLKLQSYSPTDHGEGHNLVLSLFTHRERLMNEQLVLRSAVEGGSLVTLKLMARVLGKGKGTPSLKTGIKVVGVELEDESSDWQGFT